MTAVSGWIAAAKRATDQLVLERLAWGLRLTLEQRLAKLPEGSTRGVEAIIDPDLGEAERLRASRSLRLNELHEVRAVALPPSVHVSGPRPLSAVVASAAGIVRASVEVREDPAQEIDSQWNSQAGIGPWVPVSALPESWLAAVTAL